MLIPSPPAPGPLVSVGREHFTVYPGVPAYPSHEYAVVCEHHSGELCLCDLKKTPLNTQRQSLKSQVSLTAHTGQVVSKICCNTIQTGPRAVRAHTPQRIYSLASTNHVMSHHVLIYLDFSRPPRHPPSDREPDSSEERPARIRDTISVTAVGVACASAARRERRVPDTSDQPRVPRDDVSRELVTIWRRGGSDSHNKCQAALWSAHAAIVDIAAIDKGQRYKRVTKRSCETFPACEGTWRAMHELNPNRGVKPGAHTACASLCAHEGSQSPNLCSSSAMYPHWLRHTAGAGQHRLIRSAPSRPADVAESHRMIYHHHARQGLALSRTHHPASRSMTSPSPSMTVMIRPAADENTARDGRLEYIYSLRTRKSKLPSPNFLNVDSKTSTHRYRKVLT